MLSLKLLTKWGFAPLLFSVITVTSSAGLADDDSLSIKNSVISTSTKSKDAVSGSSRLSVEPYYSWGGVDFPLSSPQEWKTEGRSANGLLIGITRRKVTYQVGIADATVTASYDEKRGPLASKSWRFGKLRSRYLQMPMGAHFLLKQWKSWGLYTRTLAIPMWKISQTNEFYQIDSSSSSQEVVSASSDFSPTPTSFTIIGQGGLGVQYAVVSQFQLRFEGAASFSTSTLPVAEGPPLGLQGTLLASGTVTF